MAVISAIESHFDQLVGSWLASRAFDQALTNAFGLDVAGDRIESLRRILLDSGESTRPRITELNPNYLNNHYAAYSADTNTIYVDPDLKSFPGLAENVLAHELGHWLDFQIHGDYTDHAAVRDFANSLTGNANPSEPSDGHSDHPLVESSELRLPGGQTVTAQFFDTPIHVAWISQQLPFLSETAKAIIADGQNDTDYFNAERKKMIGTGGRLTLRYSPYGLQTHAPSHFDNNNISGGLMAIRSRWEDGISRFNSSLVSEVTSEQFLGVNNIDGLANPLISGADAGVRLLLYRFGQINHAFEDFYSHSNWIESVKEGLIAPDHLLEGGLDLPKVLQPGDLIPGTAVMIAQSGPSWSTLLKKSGTGIYTEGVYDVYWNVNSTDPAKGGGKLSATTLDGKTVYGLATGATDGAIYKDRDQSVFLRDPSKTKLTDKEYFRGFDHGGLAGTKFGQWVGPLNKDEENHPNFLNAKKLANLQLQNEWDRMGNLIYKSYGAEGLRKFANLALATQEARDAYVATFSTSGARYFGSALPLTLSTSLVAAESGGEAGADAASLSYPEIRQVRLFGLSFNDPAGPFAGYQDRYQFKDPATGVWLDTDFNNISIHHDLSADEWAMLTTPSQVQRLDRGERATWSLSREDSIDESGTNYFVELANQSVNVYIDDFDPVHDRIVLVDAAGKEVRLADSLYAVPNIALLTAELSKYGVFIDFRPDIGFDPEVVLVAESQLASPLVIRASSVVGDVEGGQLFFTGYDGSVPFLSLVDGALRATVIDPKYSGKTYTAYVDVSDGVSVFRTVPLRIAVAPKLLINGQAFDSDTSFSLRINSLTQQGFGIVAQVSDDLENTLDQFVSIATSIGSANGAPAGYDSSELNVKLTDDLDSGTVAFWLQDAAGGLRPLNVQFLPGGGFGLSLDAIQIARIAPVASTAVVPDISTVSSPDVLDDGLGLKLNQAYADVSGGNGVNPWRVSLSLDLFREAAYPSQVGFFLFDQVAGSIIDPVTGIPADGLGSDWFKDAERFAAWTGTTDNMKPRGFNVSFTVDGRVDLDSIALMPFMKTLVDGQFFYYSTFDGLNADGARHVSMISRNVFGFEDKPGLGDSDGDDMILRVNSLNVL